MAQLTDTDKVEDLISGSRPAFLFKHSSRCPISARAHREVKRFQSAHPDSPVAWGMVLVVEDRPVSRWIESRLEIAHASPQLLLVVEGSVAWHATHGSITKDSIAAALRQQGLELGDA